MSTEHKPVHPYTVLLKLVIEMPVLACSQKEAEEKAEKEVRDILWNHRHQFGVDEIMEVTIE